MLGKLLGSTGVSVQCFQVVIVGHIGRGERARSFWLRFVGCKYQYVCMQEGQAKRYSRRQFLARSGQAALVLGAAQFAQTCNGPAKGRMVGAHPDDPLANARANGFSAPIMQAINAGITAPNPHNTQPWIFAIKNDLEMDLFVDPARVLPQTDPTHRQVHIGHGTFLEHLSIGAAQIGFLADIQILPAGDVTLAKGKRGAPTATVRLRAGRVPAQDDLYAALCRRQTNRTQYAGPLISAAEVQNIARMMGRTHSTLVVKNQAEEIERFVPILVEGMRIESLTRRTNEESRLWFRFYDKEIYEKRDGINLPGNGVTGLQRRLATFFMSSPEGFHDPSGIERYLQRFEAAMRSAKALAYLRTSGNSKRDWILAGRDYARLHLCVTHFGLAMHPTSQVLQEFAEMEGPRVAFESLSGTPANQKVQMIVRLGRSDYSFTSPRRPLSAMQLRSS